MIAGPPLVYLMLNQVIELKKLSVDAAIILGNDGMDKSCQATEKKQNNLIIYCRVGGKHALDTYFLTTFTKTTWFVHIN